ncbi:MAG TPA: adenosylcobalamin-dependent ribonucleoside-diphosphate reductase, partial [Chroococcales cyanobacterium]
MFSENALKVLEKRYFLRDEQGQVKESVEQLFRRVATAVAQAEQHFGETAESVELWSDRFFAAMHSRQFMPNSPTLMNAGKPGGQLSACFVLPVPDSLEGIFETCKNAALIHKTGGGTGFSFSRLRPQNDLVASSTGVASGPVSFMMVYDAATEAIRQGGTRRGANMGMLRVDHPDIEEFIACKRDTSRLNNFNISVAATDEFMQAVEADADYELIHPRNRKPVRTVRAREIFAKLVENAHATGEPGLIFIDRINKLDPIETALDEHGVPIPGTEEIEATNPCGEQPLGPGDACNLGSINVAAFVDIEKREFRWQELGEMIDLGVRFLDDVVDVNNYPLPFIGKATLNNRRIGLGLMGWAEALLLLEIPYDTEEAIARAEELMKFMQERAHKASHELARQRGTFPNWRFSKSHENGVPMRNATVTTIAPTGTISIIAGTSSGIEPLFAISFVRRVMGGTELIDVNPLFERVARERGFYTAELMQKIAEQGTLRDLAEVPEDIRRLWVCSHDISYDYHVRMQVAFQKHTDNAVSKTINFPKEATVQEVENAYLAAWRQGLKGITVYRDTSRRSQVLNIGKTDPLKALVTETDLPKKGHFARRVGTNSPRLTPEHNFSKFRKNQSLQVVSGTQSARAVDSNVHPIYGLGCAECSTGSHSMA